jgi:hypothetical protein
MNKLRRTTKGFLVDENLVRLSLYVWLVQMKEEQGEEDNQSFLSFKRPAK